MTNEKMLQIINSIMNKEVIDLEKVREALTEDIRAELNKHKSMADKDKILKKLWNKETELRPDNHKHYTQHNDLYCFFDGYRLYALKNNYGYEQSKGTFNIEAAKPKYNDICVKIDVNDLKLFIKTSKAGKVKKPIYVLENDKIKIGFNPKYLIEFCEMFDTDVIYCRAPSASAYYENSDGEWGVVFPVRLKD